MASVVPGKVKRGTQGLSPERAQSQAGCHSPTIPPGALNLGCHGGCFGHVPLLPIAGGEDDPTPLGAGVQAVKALQSRGMTPCPAEPCGGCSFPQASQLLPRPGASTASAHVRRRCCERQ